MSVRRNSEGEGLSVDIYTSDSLPDGYAAAKTSVVSTPEAPLGLTWEAMIFRGRTGDSVTIRHIPNRELACSVIEGYFIGNEDLDVYAEATQDRIDRYMEGVYGVPIFSIEKVREPTRDYRRMPK